MARKIEHVERRALVAISDVNCNPMEKRKRSTIIDDLLAITDDGQIIHVPTGVRVDPPKDPEGIPRAVDLRQFAYYLLDADPEGWAETRTFGMGGPISPALARRLVKIRDAYSGD
jgi:hypothetical protein